MRLTNAATPGRPPSGTYRFSFQTAWDDTPNAPGAVVRWSANSQTVVSAYKRSLEPPLMYVDVVDADGEVVSFSRPMTDDEVSRPQRNCWDIYHVRHDSWLLSLACDYI